MVNNFSCSQRFTRKCRIETENCCLQKKKEDSKVFLQDQLAIFAVGHFTPVSATYCTVDDSGSRFDTVRFFVVKSSREVSQRVSHCEPVSPENSTRRSTLRIHKFFFFAGYRSRFGNSVLVSERRRLRQRVRLKIIRIQSSANSRAPFREHGASMVRRLHDDRTGVREECSTL